MLYKSTVTQLLKPAAATTGNPKKTILRRSSFYHEKHLCENS